MNAYACNISVCPIDCPRIFTGAKSTLIIPTLIILLCTKKEVSSHQPAMADCRCIAGWHQSHSAFYVIPKVGLRHISHSSCVVLATTSWTQKTKDNQIIHSELAALNKTVNHIEKHLGRTKLHADMRLMHRSFQLSSTRTICDGKQGAANNYA